MEKEDLLRLARYDFRPATNTDEDFNIYFNIKSDPEAIKYSGFNSAPNPDRFRAYYQKLMHMPDQHLYYLVGHKNHDVVCATFHYCDVDEVTVEGLGYNVFPLYRGNKLGWVMMEKINALCKEQGYKYRLSKVAESNIPSIKNLEKSGAKPTGEVEYRHLEALGREEKYFIYIKEL